MAKRSLNSKLLLLLLILCSVLLLLCLVFALIDYAALRFNSSGGPQETVNVKVGIELIDSFENNTPKNVKRTSGKPSKNQRGSNRNCWKNEKIKFTPYIPKYMLDLYEQLNVKYRRFEKENDTVPVVDVVKSLIPRRSKQFFRQYLNWNNITKTGTEECNSMLFDLPQSNTEEKLIRSELRLLSLIENPNTVSAIERFVRIEYTNSTSYKNTTIESKFLRHFANKWEVFDVSGAAACAASTSADVDANNMVEMTLTVCIRDYELRRHNGNLRMSVHSSGEHNCEHDYPILLLSYRTGTQKGFAPGDGVYGDDLGGTADVSLRESRTKRQTDGYYDGIPLNIDNEDYLADGKGRKQKRQANSCRRKPLYIDFSDVNYDTWIVQPSGYESYQCAGRCFYPITAHLSPTKHAVLQTLLHSVNPAKAPRCSCVPTRLDSISLLYVDSRGVLTYRYAYGDMVVVECGCR